MKCLVTGGAGFIGTNLIKRLIKEGHEVVSVDNYSTGKKENHQEGCEYYDYDLSSHHTLGIYVDHNTYPSWRDIDFDIIFHMAALARIQTSLKDPYLHIKNNFDSTLNIVELARKKNIPIIYAGSSSKHHGVKNSPYSWVKWSGEELCKLYSEVYDMSISICRFYNVYGPHQLEEGDYSTVVGIFKKQYETKQPLTIVGDGEQRRDFTHINDIVDGLIRVFRAMHGEVDMRYSGAEFELGRGVNYSINELANMFGEQYPKKYITSRKGEYPITLCDDKPTKEILDWNPTHSLENYIGDVLKENVSNEKEPQAFEIDKWTEEDNKFSYDFFKKIANRKPFAFSRWGDGEWYTVSLSQPNNHNKDGNIYYSDLGMRLREILSKKQNYYMGHQNVKMYTLQDHFPTQDWVNSDILHEISEHHGLDYVYELFDSMPIVFIGNESLQKLPFIDESIVIPYNNVWLEYERVLNEIKSVMTDEHKTFLFAAGMCAEVFIDDLWNFNNKNTYIDIGSVFDPYVGRITRKYHHRLKLNEN